MNPSSFLTRRKLIATGIGVALFGFASRMSGVAQNNAQVVKSRMPTSNPTKSKGGVRVVPYPALDPIGRGKERALVLGGGGEWFEAWQLAYVEALAKNGVDLSLADAVVGTSAGSVLGTCLTSGRIAQEVRIFERLGKHPDYMAKLIMANTGAQSQLRARELQRTTTNCEPFAIQTIGRAAMAAKNAPVEGLQIAIQEIIGPMHWPSPKMHITACDCYTGERIVIYPDSGIPICEAISASMSLPGCFGPTWVDDHYCMDGGISRSGTHADLMAGAKRLVVLALSNGDPQYAELSPFHAPIEEELEVVRKSGSEVFVTYAHPPKGTNFLDPKEMPVAVERGLAQAKADLPALSKLWNR